MQPQLTRGMAALLDHDTPPRVGDMWPSKGGWYAGIIRNPHSDEQWHLILLDCATMYAPWGEPDQLIPGDFSHEDGAANTRLILSANPTNYAALYCSTQGPDCYWPASGELNLLHTNLRDRFVLIEHWSSSQTSDLHAQHQRFGASHTGPAHKDRQCAIRPVRRVLIGGAA